MSATPSDGGAFRQITLAKLRLYSGVVLFVYVTIHLLNHAVGLISLEAMEAVNEPIKALIRFTPVSIVLYGALGVHVLAVTIRVVMRRSLSMSPSEWIQLVLGFAIPFLLLTHVMGTRHAAMNYDLNDNYIYVLLSTFVFAPHFAIFNALGLIAAWVHGCIGMYQWLKLYRWYTPFVHEWLLGFCVLLPAAALASFLFNGRLSVQLSQDGEFMGEYFAQLGVTDDAVFAQLSQDVETARWFLIAFLIVAMLARLIQWTLLRRRKQVQVRYMEGPTVTQQTGPTLLEISRINNVPHASVCGGRGRCSTCRVRIVNASQALDSPDESEIRVLSRYQAGPDVRLACQLRPKGSIDVLRLLPADATMAKAASLDPWSSGQERVVTVMFCDLRDFTKTAEKRLPFDVVYLINQFSQAMGQCVEQENGRIDKFLGDGFMALFGLTSDPERGAAASLAATSAMQIKLAELNERLKNDLDGPLRMGVGVHSGSVVIGDMGYGAARGLTAIGDTVNTASRLEAATKEHGTMMCISAHTIELAGMKMPENQRKAVTIRGKSSSIDIMAADDLTQLQSSADETDVPQTELTGETT